MVVATKAKGFLRFEPGPNLVVQGCLPGKFIVEVIPNRSCFILVTSAFTKIQHFDNRKVLGPPRDNICIIVCAKAPQKSS